ncbi:hypothetical protein MPSEU_000261800 [Mayamaea pseudoterrestris]|nr:hypothetical protein MPSEU_000261800 [Mayamaea pseudoterrestris]
MYTRSFLLLLSLCLTSSVQGGWFSDDTKGSVNHSANKLASDAKSSLFDAKDAITEKASETWDRTKDASSDLGHKAADKAAAAKRKAEEKASQARDRLEAKGEQARKQAERKSKDAKHRGQHAWGAAKNEARPGFGTRIKHFFQRITFTYRD